MLSLYTSKTTGGGREKEEESIIPLPERTLFHVVDRLCVRECVCVATHSLR